MSTQAVLLPALLLSIALALATAIAVPIVSDVVDKVVDGGEDTLQVASKFQEFTKKFNKVFKDKAEEAHRQKVFAKNLDIIKELNEKKAGGEGVVYGVTEFSILTPEEFQAQMLPATSTANIIVPTQLKKGKSPHVNRTRPSHVGHRQKRQYPTNFDWRTYGGVTSVKNQGACGCCWSFAATAAIESQYALWYSSLVNLAEQQLLNCDSTSSGCNGGFYHSALDWAQANGINYESAAPYAAVKQTCSSLSGSKIYVAGKDEMWGWTEEQMKEYLYDYGPIAISFGMGADTQSYTGGIYQASSCPGINHAMLAVGYGVENNVPYWLIKNSWGTGWGISGYFKVKRNVNQCSFANQNVGTWIN